MGEYQQRFSDRSKLKVCCCYTENGNFRKANVERSVQQEFFEEEAVLNMVKNSSSCSIRKKPFLKNVYIVCVQFNSAHKSLTI